MNVKRFKVRLKLSLPTAGSLSRVVTVRPQSDEMTAEMSSGQSTHHVPAEVDEPEDDRLNTANKLEMSRAGLSLLDQEHHKAGGDLTHGKDDADCNEHIDATCTPVTRQ